MTENQNQLTQQEYKVWMEFKDFLNSWMNDDISTGDTASYLEYFYEKLFPE